ncbi:LUD domain-containing protein [Abyssalbus ytuae]|uniref:Lactate utilization protein n=1 Tax=Abyssalbus ytuae TaxID=2926907 RepID=A0A9E6ZLT8_9FLAO|nr:LUD domain-containing protein [Abyssalbus ytuae]UOB16999.1 lactate utilization protein [Abyssalbus ytuae]
MSLFKKLFGSKKSDVPNKNIEQRGKFMPEIKLPTDEKFTINFKKNGGKFLYCESFNEIFECFNSILDENQWYKKNVFCIDEKLEQKFNDFDINFSKSPANSLFFLTTCENLVADNGAILISSNQIKEEKLQTLPDNFIVFATTSQLVNSIGEGLRGIKNKNKNKIPTNITTIKHFNVKEEEKDFLSYGTSAKNLYLLLLEDL